VAPAPLPSPWIYVSFRSGSSPRSSKPARGASSTLLSRSKILEPSFAVRCGYIRWQGGETSIEELQSPLPVEAHGEPPSANPPRDA
jgi:hypothetical protein